MTTTGAPQPSSFKGLNPIKLAVNSIHRTVDFYTKVLPFTYLPQYDHFTPEHKSIGSMFIHKPSKLLVDARYHPEQAAAQEGWDPVTFGVGTRKDLEAWCSWFEECGVVHSPILTGVKGWLIAAEDPNWKTVRLYVEDEEHKSTDTPDVDEKWLGILRHDPSADGSN